MAARKKKAKTALYFTTAAAYPGNRVALGGHLVAEGDEPTGTRLMLRSATAWGHHDDIPEVVYDLAVRLPRGETKRRLCVLGRSGFYREYVPGEGHVDEPIAQADAGYLESLAVVGDAMFACGANGQVHRRHAQRWEPIHGDLYVPFDGKTVKRMLLSLDGFGEDDVYVCSFEGKVWHFDGRRWTDARCPARFALNGALCAPDGRAYFCGESGGMFVRNPDGAWTNIPHDGALHDVAWLDGRVYVAGGDALFRVEGDAMRAIPSPNEGSWRFLRLGAADDRVWCVGDEDVFAWDGRAWTRHVCPENVAPG